MSPPALEFDFGFSSLLDSSQLNPAGNTTTNTLASSLSDFNNTNNNGATASAADYLSLSNFFDSAVVPNASSASVAPAGWQTKKAVQQQQQQLQQEQNSLNALLSQHTAAQTQQQQTTTTSTTTPNPFTSFATREELESLASNHAAATTTTPQQTTTTFQVAAPATTATASNNNNYMFVATIVDPTQGEDAPPQQMLFLPGSNQVIPMPTTTTTNSTSNGLSSMMTLANLPVVFPQGTTTNTTTNTTVLPSTAELTGNFTSALQAQQQLQQQQQGLFGASTNELETAFSQALAPAPPMELQSYQQPLQPAPVPAPVVKAAMPVRPLSAYNFFFSDERERILQNKTDGDDVFDNHKKQRLLLAHLAKDRSKRRPHRKTHGKINFTTLSKLIGQRWKGLPDERKNFYREVAAIDLERYQRELRERSPPQGATSF